MANATDRIALLKQRLEQAGISNHENWVYDAEAEGDQSSHVESVTLFRAIQDEMLSRDRPEWLDQFAKNVSGRQADPSRFHQAILAVAASNVDRAALVEVIRYFQSHIAFMFFNIHDDTRPASHEDEGLAFRIAYEDRSGYADGDYDRRVERMRLLNDELHAQYENFLVESGDDFGSSR